MLARTGWHSCQLSSRRAARRSGGSPPLGSRERGDGPLGLAYREVADGAEHRDGRDRRPVPGEVAGRPAASDGARAGRVSLPPATCGAATYRTTTPAGRFATSAARRRPWSALGPPLDVLVMAADEVSDAWALPRRADALLTLGRTRAAGESALSAMAASVASGAALERAEAYLVSDG